MTDFLAALDLFVLPTLEEVDVGGDLKQCLSENRGGFQWRRWVPELVTAETGIWFRRPILERLAAALQQLI